MKTIGQLIHDSDLDAEHKREATKKLRIATADEIDILAGLFDGPDSWKHFGEIFRGGYVRIIDKGARYDDWKTLPSASTRYSSHDSEGDQYHIDGPLSHTILFGKFGPWTWLQLENSTTHGLYNLAVHGIDFVKYKLSGENQGPYGTSNHSEKNAPLVIHPSKPYVPINRKSWVYTMNRQPRFPGRSPFRANL